MHEEVVAPGMAVENGRQVLALESKPAVALHGSATTLSSTRLGAPRRECLAREPPQLAAVTAKAKIPGPRCGSPRHDCRHRHHAFGHPGSTIGAPRWRSARYAVLLRQRMRHSGGRPEAPRLETQRCAFCASLSWFPSCPPVCIVGTMLANSSTGLNMTLLAAYEESPFWHASFRGPLRAAGMTE